MTISAPFFIVGASRSGTTLLRLMLNKHPNICVPNELHFFKHFANIFDLKEGTCVVPQAVFLNRVESYLTSREQVFGPGVVESCLNYVRHNKIKNIKKIYEAILKIWAQSEGKSHWGEKTPANLFYVDVLARMFPLAKFVYLLRDPRGVVNSMNKFKYLPSDTVVNTYNWHRSVTVGYSRLCASTREENRIEVKYENLVQDPSSSMQRILHFLQEPYDASVLSFYKDSEDVMNGRVLTPTIKRPVSAHRAYKWKDEMNPRDIAMVEYLCRPEMESMGYEVVSRQNLSLSSKVYALSTFKYCLFKEARREDQRFDTIGYTFLQSYRR